MVYRAINILQEHHAISVEEDGFTWIDFLWLFFFFFQKELKNFNKMGICQRRKFATEKNCFEKNCSLVPYN